MARPAVLVVEPESSRRKDLSRGLSASGYEVVPAVDGAEGRRFAASLEPGVVVAPAGLAGFGEGAVRAGCTLLLLGEGEAGGDVPEQALYLDAAGLSAADLVRRVRLVLLGREIGVEADAALESLVGDLALMPPLELLRGLGAALFSGRAELPGGWIRLAGGEVTAARAGRDGGKGRVTGVKAFCRLARHRQGSFRVVLAGADSAPAGEGGERSGDNEREIHGALPALLIQAIEDVVHDAPDPRLRVRLEVGARFFETRFTPRQQELLAALGGGATVARLLDELPASDGDVFRDLLGLAELGIVVLEEPQEQVRVVTDSTADLPEELARAHGIQVVPLLVLLGDRVYHDGVDLRPREFYEQLERARSADDSPRTNPTPRHDFLAAYRTLAPRQDVISLHLSGKLSQTVANARAAAEEARPELQGLRGPGHPPAAVEVVDSGTVSLGLGLLALFAARLARRGLPPAEIVARLEAMRGRVHLLFAVDTLEYLKRGGRIGRARAAVGTLLGIKPILGVVDGEVVAVDKVRGGRAAHPRLIELFKARIDPARPVFAGVAHAKAPVWADRLRGLLEGTFQIAELVVAEMGPGVGTHAGPGTVGAGLFQPTGEELPLLAPLPAD
jgi:DegV family protein with EDD domain